jgi:hypothetical protein
LRAVAQLDDVLVRSNGCKGLLNETRPKLARQRLEGTTLRRSERERLLDRERLVDEVGLGRCQRNLDPVLGQVAQRQQRLDPRDPPPAIST